MLLNAHQIKRYKRLPNPPQSLYMALIKQVHVLNRSEEGRVFTVPGGGYMALAIYYYFMKQLEYTDEQIMSEAGITNTLVKRAQLYLDHLIKGDETARAHLKIKLVRNYMLLEQLKIPHLKLLNSNNF